MSHSSHTATILSVRVSPKIVSQLESLADATGRTKSFLATEALEHYLTLHAWQVKAINQAVKKAKSKKTRFIEHEKITTWLNSWGTENELEPPK